MITQAFIIILAIILVGYHNMQKNWKHKTNLYYAIDELIKANFSSNYKSVQSKKNAKRRLKKAKKQKKAMRRAMVAHSVIKNFDDMIKRS